MLFRNNALKSLVLYCALFGLFGCLTAQQLKPVSEMVSACDFVDSAGPTTVVDVAVPFRLGMKCLLSIPLSTARATSMINSVRAAMELHSDRSLLPEISTALQGLSMSLTAIRSDLEFEVRLHNLLVQGGAASKGLKFLPRAIFSGTYLWTPTISFVFPSLTSASASNTTAFYVTFGDLDALSLRLAGSSLKFPDRFVSKILNNIRVMSINNASFTDHVSGISARLGYTPDSGLNQLSATAFRIPFYAALTPADFESALTGEGLEYDLYDFGTTATSQQIPRVMIIPGEILNSEASRCWQPGASTSNDAKPTSPLDLNYVASTTTSSNGATSAPPPQDRSLALTLRSLGTAEGWAAVLATEDTSKTHLAFQLTNSTSTKRDSAAIAADAFAALRAINVVEIAVTNAAAQRAGPWMLHNAPWGVQYGVNLISLGLARSLPMRIPVLWNGANRSIITDQTYSSFVSEVLGYADWQTDGGDKIKNLTVDTAVVAENGVLWSQLAVLRPNIASPKEAQTPAGIAKRVLFVDGSCTSLCAIAAIKGAVVGAEVTSGYNFLYAGITNTVGSFSGSLSGFMPLPQLLTTLSSHSSLLNQLYANAPYCGEEVQFSVASLFASGSDSRPISTALTTTTSAASASFTVVSSLSQNIISPTNLLQAAIANFPVSSDGGSSFVGSKTFIGVIVGAVVLFFIVSIGVFVFVSSKMRSVASAPTTGPICLLFTDVEDSAVLWRKCPEGMRDAMRLHSKLVRQVLRKYKAYEVKMIGDSFMVATTDATTMLNICVGVQKIINDNNLQWVELLGKPLNVRMGFHVGEPRAIFDEMTKGYDYLGNDVNLAARILSSVATLRQQYDEEPRPSDSATHLVALIAATASTLDSVPPNAVPPEARVVHHEECILKGIDQPTPLCLVGVEVKKVIIHEAVNEHQPHHPHPRLQSSMSAASLNMDSAAIDQEQVVDLLMPYHFTSQGTNGRPGRAREWQTVAHALEIHPFVKDGTMSKQKLLWSALRVANILDGIVAPMPIEEARAVKNSWRASFGVQGTFENHQDPQQQRAALALIALRVLLMCPPSAFFAG